MTGVPRVVGGLQVAQAGICVECCPTANVGGAKVSAVAVFSAGRPAALSRVPVSWRHGLPLCVARLLQVPSYAAHPIKLFLEKGIRATVNRYRPLNLCCSLLLRASHVIRYGRAATTSLSADRTRQGQHGHPAKSRTFSRYVGRACGYIAR